MVALLEKRAGEELFRKHVATVVQGAVAALAAELGASGAGAGSVTGAAAADGTPGKAAGAASTGAAPGPTPQKDGGGEGGGPPPGSRFLDTMAFLNDLGRCAGCTRCMWLACLKAAELLQPWRQLPAPLWARSRLLQRWTRAALTNPAPLLPLPPCRAGSFRREMAPFAARWVYGRGVPHVTAAFIYHA